MKGLSTLHKVAAFAPAPMWLFWIVASVVTVYGAVLRDYSAAEPRFLVSTGNALEVWKGTRPERTLLSFDDRSAVLDPAISPAGDRIAFVRYPPFTTDAGGKDNLGEDLYVANIDGTGSRTVIQHEAYGEFIGTPLWLPGGKELGFAVVTPTSDGGADRRIEAVELETGVRRRLMDNADEPILMPDQQHLLVRLTDFRRGRSGETPVLYDLHSGQVTDLPGYHGSQLYISSFVVSPDRRLIAFGGTDVSSVAMTRTDSGGRLAARFNNHPLGQDVWVMTLDGQDLHRVAELGSSNMSLAWSADGTSLYALTPSGFWRVNVQTGTYQKIGPGLPDGRIRLLASR